MPIPLVSNTGTYDLWIARTNQAIGVINQLTDGVLTVNGSIIFSNSVFALSLPSLNVANNLVITSPSGNSLFLQSSSAVVNGAIHLRGSGTGLFVSNNASITGNVSVGSHVVSTGPILGLNEIRGSGNTMSGVIGQYRLVQNSFGTILRSNGSHFQVLTTGSNASPSTANFNTLRPFTFDQSTGQITFDTTSAGALFGGSIKVSGVGTALTVDNGSTFSGKVNVAGPGTALVVTNSGSFGGGLTVSGTASVGTIVATSGSIDTFTATSITTSSEQITTLLTGNRINASGELQATLGSGVAQVRMVQGNHASFLRNDGSSFYILSSDSAANSYNSTFNSFRPFAFSLTTGAVTLDATGLGVSTGGTVSPGSSVIIPNNIYYSGKDSSGTTRSLIGMDINNRNSIPSGASGLVITNQGNTATLISVTSNGFTNFTNTVSIGTQSITNGLTLNGTQFVIPSLGTISARNTSGTVKNLLSVDSSNRNLVYCGTNGLIITNEFGNTSLVTITNSGDFSISGGSFTFTGSAATFSSAITTPSITINSSQYYYGRDTGGTPRPLIGMIAGITTTWAGPSYWRLIRNDGALEFVTVDNNGNFSHKGLGFFATESCLVVGSSLVNSTPGAVQASWGYQVKAGVNGGFRSNGFNIDWDGASTHIYIDNTIAASFSFGTNISDRRIKENISLKSETTSYNAIKNVNVYNYNLRSYGIFNSSGEQKLGFIADELMTTIPESVSGTPDGLMDNGDYKLQRLDPIPIIAQVTNALKHLISKVENLETRITNLENS